MSLDRQFVERLLRLRLVVGRFGEMDIARWWNTNGQLGNLGAVALRRGFPRTHFFAQARSVFSVAAHRCEEMYDPTGSVTLWRLPQVIEDEFELAWEHWLDHASDWSPMFHSLQTMSTDLVEALRSFSLVTDRDLEAYSRLRRAAEGRAVPLPEPFQGTQDDITLLALGFARGEVGALAVPFARQTNG